MPERTLTYFVSDVHLGLQVANPEDREARFVRFLQSIPRETTESLYLLGDIWDFWYEYRDVVPKGYVKVFAQIIDLIESGVNVYFFQGNHDIWCYHYFEELGMKILQQPYEVEIGGRVFCLGHGDALGPGFHLYKVMRWAFRNSFFQHMFSMLHPTIAYRFGTGWSKSSRQKKLKSEYVFKGEKEPLYRFAAEWEKDHKVDFFVFGHFHSRVDMRTPGGSRLLLLKDWIKDSSYLYFDGITISGGILPKIEK